ncbi:MAG: hypothetical protein HYY84_18395 [Deltaproteobacteria bacterium]|nr:hypothetical protein [Deltaproteobacteria bacterium]
MPSVKEAIGDPRVFVPAVAALIVLSLVSVNFLEARFDRADLDRAGMLVRNHRPAGAEGRTLEEALIAKFGNTATGELIWSAELKSSCAGIVRVTARVPTAGGLSEYAWDVLVTESRIHPGNEPGRALLIELATRRANDAERR